jgi:hypothetical protein
MHEICAYSDLLGYLLVDDGIDKRAGGGDALFARHELFEGHTRDQLLGFRVGPKVDI